MPIGSPRPTTTQFAKLVKFSYLWLRQSFSYVERDRWQTGFSGN
jgi:hypothetical protein